MCCKFWFVDLSPALDTRCCCKRFTGKISPWKQFWNESTYTKIVLEKQNLTVWRICPAERFKCNLFGRVWFGSCWGVTNVLVLWFQLTRLTCRSWYSMASACLRHCMYDKQDIPTKLRNLFVLAERLVSAQRICPNWWGFQLDAKKRTIYLWQQKYKLHYMHKHLESCWCTRWTTYWQLGIYTKHHKTVPRNNPRHRQANLMLLQLRREILNGFALLFGWLCLRNPGFEEQVAYLWVLCVAFGHAYITYSYQPGCLWLVGSWWQAKLWLNAKRCQYLVAFHSRP